MAPSLRAPFLTSRGRAGRNGEPREARGGRRTDGKKYVNDEQRREATPVRPALRVAAAGGHLHRHSSSTYCSQLIRLRRRSSDLTAWRTQRGSREVRKGALTLLRVVDANLNRAHEGLRVCEDLVRFALGWPGPVRVLRGIRHALTPKTLGLSRSSLALLRARNSLHDPGRTFVSSRVDSIEQLLLINLQRAKESIRVLEESARLLAPMSAKRLQRLRFRLYDAERNLLISVAMAAVRDRRRRSHRQS